MDTRYYIVVIRRTFERRIHTYICSTYVGQIMPSLAGACEPGPEQCCCSCAIPESTWAPSARWRMDGNRSQPGKLSTQGAMLRRLGYSRTHNQVPGNAIFSCNCGATGIHDRGEATTARFIRETEWRDAADIGICKLAMQKMTFCHVVLTTWYSSYSAT